MTRHYFMIIFRDLTKRKGFTLINFLGLSMAFAICLIIVLYVYTEFSFDKDIPDVNNKYRITISKSGEQMANLPYNLKELLEPQLPTGSELAVVTTSGEYAAEDLSFEYNQNFYKFKSSIFADSRILSMLGISMLAGSSECTQQSSNQILISQKTSQAIFGNKNAIGQILKSGNLNFIVSGIFRDLPANTHRTIELISLRPLDLKITFDQENSWGYNMFDYYLKLPATSNIRDVESNIQKIYTSAHPDFRNASEKEKGMVTFKLEPISDIHLHSNQIKWDSNKIKGSTEMVFVFIAVGILILLMAVFNYINLTTAYYQTKNTLSGNLKVFGASTSHLLQYIYLQTSLIVMLGFAGSIGIVRILLPKFNDFLSRQIAFSLLFNPIIAVFILLFIFIVILLAGAYPAIKFSGMTPIKTLKRMSFTETSVSKCNIRKVLVIAQFTISISLMIVILVMGRQIKLMSQQRLGFSAEQLIEITSFVNKKEYNILKSQLVQVSNVAGVSIANYNPGSYIADGFPLRLSGSPKESGIDGSTIVKVESNYFNLMNIQQLLGEAVNSSMEDKNNVILSRCAVDKLGLSNPIGEKIYYSGTLKDYLVVGVVDDVQYRSFREKPRPIIYSLGINGGNPVIRLLKGDHRNTISAIKDKWNTLFPDRPFDFSFFNAKIEGNYKYETNLLRMLNILMIISIVIAAVGIYGLIIEIVIQRTKEIGIRKVNGARIAEVIRLLNIEFVKWVFIAFVIATPIAWFAMHRWLENFAYKTELSWWIFALAGLLALGIALLTVSWQSWKAATRNPVEALRYE